MGLHVYNFGQLKTAVKHALGNKTDASGLRDLGQLVNDALMRFASAREWSWLQTAMSLDLTADQEYVLLPEDFFTLETIEWSNNLGCMRPATLNRLQVMRLYTNYISNSGFWYAIDWKGQIDRKTTPRARLQLYPTPTSDTTGALIGTYKRIIRAFEQDADIADIPPQYHTILKSYCRAHAMLEDGRPGADAEMQSVQGMIDNAIASDGVVQPNLGYMQGAVSRPERTSVSNTIGPGESISPP